MKNPLFFAKVLLFGEYGIIENAKGLTLPFNYYKGALKFDENEHETDSKDSIQAFYEYLLNEGLPLDFKKFKEDLDAGMYFDSDIPQGYGVGSSGALVAALYNCYALDKIHASQDINPEKIKELKQIFAKMESHFHGASSGIDPLICYLNIPLIIKSKDDISTTPIPTSAAGNGAIFLLNSGTPGKTAPMVQIFFEKLKHIGFRKTLKEEFIKYNDACVDAFVKGDMGPMFDNLKHLSAWALIHFRPMIPNRLLKVWEKGIETNDFYLKLCGSGGGGYVLGFTRDYEKAKPYFKDFSPEIIHQF